MLVERRDVVMDSPGLVLRLATTAIKSTRTHVPMDVSRLVAAMDYAEAT